MTATLMSNTERKLLFYDPPEMELAELMEFRLFYNGELLRASSNGNSRAWEKHQIRKVFHSQLEVLWKTHPVLKFYGWSGHVEPGSFAKSVVQHTHTVPDEIGRRWEGFIPVVNSDFGVFCELDILFLRAEPIGNIVKRDSTGGDLDNRLKTLLDALSIPQRGAIRDREGDEPTPSPMYVLMSDDSLITSVRVTADRLLTRITDDPAEACAIIQVKAFTADPTLSPYKMPL